MKASIESTTEVVTIRDIDGNVARARVWAGLSETGVRFTAYITNIQVARSEDNSQFERELQEHSQPDAETRRAIGLRFVI